MIYYGQSQGRDKDSVRKRKCGEELGAGTCGEVYKETGGDSRQ